MASCTLYGILARDGRSAVVFRRGPSRAVLLLRWWLKSDKIEEGQWFRGRIYEDRSDLSPNGEHLVYFAAKHKRPFGTWTAISRPPFLTALALWPVGDTWSGGGTFSGPHEVALAHRADQMQLAQEFTLPKHWRVEQLPDRPIERIRLVRAGWEITPGKAHRRRHKPGNSNVILSSFIVRSGSSDQRSAEVSDPRGRILRRFEVADWVEFADDGDLLIGTGGCLYRLPAHRVARASDDPLEGAKLVADLRPLTFRPRMAPADNGDPFARAGLRLPTPAYSPCDSVAHNL